MTIKDKNYNARATYDDGSEDLVFVNNLSNRAEDYFEGWLCKSGVTSIYIYQNEVWGGECRNDRLGTLDDWELLTQDTVCKTERCYGCTTDMLQAKKKA